MELTHTKGLASQLLGYTKSYRGDITIDHSRRVPSRRESMISEMSLDQELDNKEFDYDGYESDEVGYQSRSSYEQEVR